jgi:hypothetical protein
MSREVERRGLTAVSGAASVVVWVVTAPDAPHALVTVVVTVGIFVDPRGTVDSSPLCTLKMSRRLFPLLLVGVSLVQGEDIHAAVRSNDMAKVKEALASGEDINKIGKCHPPLTATDPAPPHLSHSLKRGWLLIPTSPRQHLTGTLPLPLISLMECPLGWAWWKERTKGLHTTPCTMHTTH